MSPASDLDLLCHVRACGEPETCERIVGDWEARHAHRADLEIVFPSGRAVSWREWRDVRSPASATKLVLETLAAGSGKKKPVCSLARLVYCTSG